MWCALQWKYSVYVYERTHEKFLEIEQSKPKISLEEHESDTNTQRYWLCANIAFVVKKKKKMVILKKLSDLKKFDDYFSNYNVRKYIKKIEILHIF